MAIRQTRFQIKNNQNSAAPFSGATLLVGEPIVNTPAEAFAHLEKGSIDYLLIGNKIYKKK